MWEDLKKIFEIIKGKKFYKMVIDNNKFISLNISVFVISDTRNERSDKSGKVLEDHITKSGHKIFEKKFIKDDKKADCKRAKQFYHKKPHKRCDFNRGNWINWQGLYSGSG